MSITSEQIITLLLIGGYGGWWFGRMVAENRRARHDMQNTWDKRQDYRSFRRWRS